MANEGKDIRDLTRALNANTKAVEALQKTLVEIEHNRVQDSNKKVYCMKCVVGNHFVSETYDPHCPCCALNHQPSETWVEPNT